MCSICMTQVDVPDADLADGGAPETFVSSPSFVGPRPGFIFKRGPSGVGYYHDVGPSANSLALEPETTEQLATSDAAAVLDAMRARTEVCSTARSRAPAQRASDVVTLSP